MVAFLVVAVSAFLIALLYFKQKDAQKQNQLLDALRQDAQAKAKMVLDAAELKAKELVFEAERKLHAASQECHKLEKSLDAKEQQLEREKAKMQLQRQELDKKEKSLLEREKAQEENAALTATAVKEQITREVEKECQLYLLHKRQEVEQHACELSQKLVVEALARLPVQALKEASLVELKLPNEEIKAKIIGREGKNIKAFQQLSGVTVVVDDTPQTIQLSSFDPERKEVAKIALVNLIKDGRITPATIEEELKRASKLLEDRLIQYGQEAAREAGVDALHPTFLKLLGRLKLMTSLGQNLLEHSVEVAQIMALLAAELKLDSRKAARMGLLHDIGKALQTDVSHALAGYKLALQLGEPEEVANGIGSHHNEMPALTKEASLVKCADYLSGARLGARQENGDLFFNRLKEFELKAQSFAGVQSAFALNSGRELHVFVKPDLVSEQEALGLAKEIAQNIQQLSPTSRVQVTVIRETRAVEYSL